MQGQQTSTAPQRNLGAIETLHGKLATVERELWLLVLVTLTLDVYLTYLGLQVGLEEGNPFMDWVFETIGFAGLGLIKGMALGLAGFAREIWPRHGPVIALGLALPWLVAVCINGWLVYVAVG